MKEMAKNCKCAVAIRVLGDGCQYCNPSLALWYAINQDDEETGWQGTTGFHDKKELGDDWT